jgi:hypothetical protein
MVLKYLKIHTLEKGWHDKDEVLLHATFQILVDFVEQERPAEIVDWDCNDECKHVWSEIMSLYKWWKEERPARKSPLDDESLETPPFEFEPIPNSDLYHMIEPDKEQYKAYYQALDTHHELEQTWLEEDQRNLHRLIEIRGYLWM